jgi:hypothetical protein
MWLWDSDGWAWTDSLVVFIVYIIVMVCWWAMKYTFLGGYFIAKAAGASDGIAIVSALGTIALVFALLAVMA